MKLKKTIHHLYKFVRYLIETMWIQLSALCATYGVLVSILLVLHFFVGEESIVVSIGNNFLPLITLACIPGLFITLISPRYRFPWSLYLMPGVIAFVIWYGGLFIPSPLNTNDPESVELTVATYNVAMNRRAVDFVVNDGFDADIVGLQEVLGFPAPENFARANYRAIYMRSAILIEPPKTIYREGDTEQIAVKAKLDIDGRVVSVYSLHNFRPDLIVRPFSYETEPRTRDVRTVINEIEQDPNPIILFCDCNFSDRTDDYKLLSSHLTDTWYQKGFGLGLTAIVSPGRRVVFSLLLRSDYIWHSDHFETLSVEVVPVELSDHYAVRARLRLKNTDS